MKKKNTKGIDGNKNSTAESQAVADDVTLDVNSPEVSDIEHDADAAGIPSSASDEHASQTHSSASQVDVSAIPEIVGDEPVDPQSIQNLDQIIAAGMSTFVHADNTPSTLARADNLEAVHISHLYSMEYYLNKRGEHRQVLTDINFIAKPGEVWEIAGDSVFEQRLLLEIIANAKPYQRGECILDNRGMMRRKSTVLPHLFYIGSSNMLLDRFTAVGYLTSATIQNRSGRLTTSAARARLKTLGLGYLEDIYIEDMTVSQRSMLTLVVALETSSNIIVWNLPRLHYDKRDRQALARIAHVLIGEGRTLIMASRDYDFAQTAATGVLLLHRGQVAYCGTVKEFIHKWDHSIMDIEDPAVDKIAPFLKQRLPSFRYEIDTDNVLHISAPFERTYSLDEDNAVYCELLNNDIYPENMRRVSGLLARAVPAALWELDHGQEQTMLPSARRAALSAGQVDIDTAADGLDDIATDEEDSGDVL